MKKRFTKAELKIKIIDKIGGAAFDELNSPSGLSNRFHSLNSSMIAFLKRLVEQGYLVFRTEKQMIGLWETTYFKFKK